MLSKHSAVTPTDSGPKSIASLKQMCQILLTTLAPICAGPTSKQWKSTGKLAVGHPSAAIRLAPAIADLTAALPTQRDRGGRDGGRDGGNRRPSSPSAPQSNSRGGSNSHADQEQAALDSVNKALVTLRTETSVNEIQLDPSNSFFRRLQHKKAVSEGYYSYSTGEGAGRSVVVTREKPANEEGV